MHDWLPPLPDELPRVITRAVALERGITIDMIERRLRDGRWHRVLPGVYLTADTLTWPDRQRAALAFGGPGAVLSGAAALADTGLRGVHRPEQVLVLVPATRRARSTGFVRMRATDRLPAAALRPGPACAPVARGVADLALSLRRRDDVRSLVAEVVRRDRCTVEELAIELAAGPRNGSAHLRAAIEEVGAGAWSAPEAHAARLLRAARVPAFQQNVRIRLPDGRFLVVDFLWPQLRAVLEIDIDEHHALPPDADRTDDRHIVLMTSGYSVVHRRPVYIFRNPKAFTEGVAGWLAARAAELRTA